MVDGNSISMPDIELRGGEVNGDEVGNILDISAMAASFASHLPDRVDEFGRFVDSNADGVVNILDLTTAASNFGTTEPLVW
jgi:hypothetical protein